jgi:SRSO17 transposase
MIVQQIRALAARLSKYLAEFADCFQTPETRQHLTEYVQGQISNLPRKSIEPIADLADVPPRTLQEFLSFSKWDHDRLRDTVQRIVARDHSEPQAIGIIDESGHPKQGKKTACVHHQYCGASGKLDNCVMGVHLCQASFDGKFRAMLDSELFLPEKGWNDEKRRKEAGIPESLVYRPKHLIALGQLRRALDNGLRFGWITADIWYGEKPAFVEGLEDLELRFVLEIPKNLMGWVRRPADADTKRGEVQDLVRWSRPMVQQDWVDFHIKDTGKGAMVWEVRSAPFWLKRGDAVAGPYWLVAARDRLHPDKTKYFLSNASAGVPLEVLLHVAFTRWPVERCLEDEKSELGMSHFEVRKYAGVLRHLRITQVSHLFLARQTQRLAEKKSGRNDLPSAGCDQWADRRSVAQQGRSEAAPGQNRENHSQNSAEKCRGKEVARQGHVQAIAETRHPAVDVAMLHPGAERVAL